MVFATAPHISSSLCWQLFLLAVLWPIIYDTQYALTDKADDIKIGVRSSAIWLGEAAVVVIAALQLLFCGAWITFGIYHHFHPYTITILSTMSLFFIYQIQLCQKYNQHLNAFLNNHWVGCVIFIAIYVQYTYLP